MKSPVYFGQSRWGKWLHFCDSAFGKAGTLNKDDTHRLLLFNALDKTKKIKTAVFLRVNPINRVFGQIQAFIAANLSLDSKSRHYNFFAQESIFAFSLHPDISISDIRKEEADADLVSIRHDLNKRFGKGRVAHWFGMQSVYAKARLGIDTSKFSLGHIPWLILGIFFKGIVSRAPRELTKFLARNILRLLIVWPASWASNYEHSHPIIKAFKQFYLGVITPLSAIAIGIPILAVNFILNSAFSLVGTIIDGLVSTFYLPWNLGKLGFKFGEQREYNKPAKFALGLLGATVGLTLSAGLGILAVITAGFSLPFSSIIPAGIGSLFTSLSAKIIGTSIVAGAATHLVAGQVGSFNNLLEGNTKTGSSKPYLCRLFIQPEDNSMDTSSSSFEKSLCNSEKRGVEGNGIIVCWRWFTTTTTTNNNKGRTTGLDSKQVCSCQTKINKVRV